MNRIKFIVKIISTVMVILNLLEALRVRQTKGSFREEIRYN